jgi:prevent-host-death family protein
METVGSYEAKTHLPRLLDRVEAGEIVTITKHGRPVARLVPVVAAGVPAAEVIAALRGARNGIRLEGPSLREAREAGRS